MSEFLIKRGENTYKPSIYQEEILKFAKYGVGNCFINACAGASKTTMLENILYQLPEEKSKLFIAFNKSIVDEMSNRVDYVNNLKITTYHSLGYSILRENFPNKEFNVSEEKYSNIVRNNIIDLTTFHDISTLGKNYNTYISNIIHLVDYARYYHVSNERGINSMAERYGLNIIRDEIPICKKLLMWGSSNIDTIDYTDMVWLVNELNLTTKKYLYDTILIDEAQDTSIMQQEMTERCKKRGSRIFAVGDENQSINIWCGSDMEAIRKFNGENVKTFSLPISYRCGKNIVKLAQRFSKNIIADENAPDGEVRYNVPLFSPMGDDMVLSRNIAPLVEYRLKMLQINKKCYMKGGEDIAEKYIKHINESNSTLIDRNCNTCDGLIPKLYLKIFEIIKKLKSNGYNDSDAYSNPSVIDLYDDIQGISVLSDNLTKTDELIKKINDIFRDKSTEGIMLSTVHKAKGLEADNVYILCPSHLPSPYAKKEWEIISENNLTYVAYTRARYTLNFLIEDEHSNRCGNAMNFKKMCKKINEMQEKIAFSETYEIKEENYENSASSFQILGDKKPLFNTKNEKKKKGGLKFNNIF